MRLGGSGLAELRARLVAVRADEMMARALAEQAERMAAARRPAYRLGMRHRHKR